MKSGIAYMLLVGLCFSAMGAVARFAQAEASAFQVIFFQNLISLICIVPIVFHRRGVSGFSTSHFGLHLVRDISGALSVLTFFLAINYIPLVDAVVLNNTGPLFIPFVDRIWRKQPIGQRIWWGILIGFVGIVLILQPGGGGFHPAVFLGLASGLFMAITFVSIRILNRTEGAYVILFFYFAVATILFFPFMLLEWKPLGSETWTAMIGIGFLMVVMQTFLIQAFHRGKAVILGPLIYTAVLWSGLFEWLWWRSLPDLYSWIGIACVVTGAIISIAVGRSPHTPA